MRQTHPKLNWRREVFQILSDFLFQDLTTSYVRTEVDIAGRNNALFPFYRSQHFRSELSAGIGHGQCSGACTVFGFDDFVTAELDTLDEGSKLLSRNFWEGVGRLGEKGDDLRED